MTIKISDNQFATVKAERDRYREALLDAERVLEWGEPEPKPVLQRLRDALRGGEER